MLPVAAMAPNRANFECFMDKSITPYTPEFPQAISLHPKSQTINIGVPFGTRFVRVQYDPSLNRFGTILEKVGVLY